MTTSVSEQAVAVADQLPGEPNAQSETRRGGGLRRDVREIFWVAAPKIASGGLQLCFSLILMRFFGPAHYGVLSVCLSGVLLADSIIGGATDSGVLRLAPLYHENDLQKSVQIQRAGLLLKPLVAIVIALPLLALAPLVSKAVFQDASYAGVLYWSVAALFGLLVLRSAQMHFQVSRNFVLYGTAEILHAFLKFGGIALLLAVTRPAPGKVVAIYALAPLAITAGVLATSGRALLLAHSSMAILLELADKVKWYMATAATGTLIARMDIFLVSTLASVSEAGIYSAAQLIALIPQLIGSYVAVVFSPRIMPMFQNRTLLPFFRRFQTGAWLVAGLLYLAALFCWRPIAHLCFPASFQAASSTVLILLPAGLSAFINFPLAILIVLFLRPRFLLGLDLVLLPIILLLYAWAIPAHGAAGAAVVTTAVALFKSAVMHHTVVKTLTRAEEGPALQAAAATSTPGGIC